MPEFKWQFLRHIPALEPVETELGAAAQFSCQIKAFLLSGHAGKPVLSTTLNPLVDELVCDRYQAAIKDGLMECPRLRHYRTLLARQADAKKRLIIAESRLAELASKRVALVLEAPADLGQQLVALDEKLAEQRRAVTALETEEATLREELPGAEQAALDEFKRKAHTALLAMRGRIHEEEIAAQEEMLAAMQERFTQVAVMRLAHAQIYTSDMFNQHGRRLFQETVNAPEPPPPAAEPAPLPESPPTPPSTAKPHKHTGARDAKAKDSQLVNA